MKDKKGPTYDTIDPALAEGIARLIEERNDALALAAGRYAEAKRIKAEMQARIEALSDQVVQLQRIQRRSRKTQQRRNAKQQRKGEKRGE